MAVYAFNAAVTELQPFTTDKRAAERAVLRAHALGGTALYDALVRVNRDLAARTGKKAIVVFTDGDDNLSTLTAEIAIARAKAAGAPIYTIAQGEALRRPEFPRSAGRHLQGHRRPAVRHPRPGGDSQGFRKRVAAT